MCVYVCVCVCVCVFVFAAWVQLRTLSARKNLYPHPYAHNQDHSTQKMVAEIYGTSSAHGTAEAREVVPRDVKVNMIIEIP